MEPIVDLVHEVKGIYIKDLNIYSVTKDYNNFKYEIEGEEIPLSTATPCMIPGDQIDKLIVKIPFLVIDGYVNAKDETDNVSEERHKFDLDEILSKRDGGGNWTSLDDEFEYKKFMTTWKIKQHQEIALNRVFVKTIEVQISTGSKYIVPYWSLSTTSDENRLYRLNKVDMINDFLRDLSEKYSVMVDLSSSCEYCKVEGEYLQHNKSLFDMVDKFGTIVALNASITELKKNIETAFLVIVAKKKGIVFWIIIQNKLKNIISHVNEIEPKQRTYNKKLVACRELKEVIETLNELVSGKVV